MPHHLVSSSEEDSCDEEFETPNRSPQSNVDDEDSDVSDHFHIKTSIECPSDLKPIQVSSALITAEELESEDNEMWIVTVPCDINVKKLHHTQLPLRGKSKISVGGKNYETKMYQNGQSVNLVIPDRKGNLKLHVKKCMGNIMFAEDVFVPEDQVPILSKEEVVVPTNLKERHPIFGKDYAEVIASAKRTLDTTDPLTSKIKGTKSPKKKKKTK